MNGRLKVGSSGRLALILGVFFGALGWVGVKAGSWGRDAITRGRVDTAALWSFLAWPGPERDLLRGEVAFARLQTTAALDLAVKVRRDPDAAAFFFEASLLETRIRAFDLEDRDGARRVLAVAKHWAAHQPLALARVELLRADLAWWLDHDRELAFQTWQEQTEQLAGGFWGLRLETRLALADLARGRRQEAARRLRFVALQQESSGDLSGLAETLNFLSSAAATGHDAAGAYASLQAARVLANQTGNKRQLQAFDRAMASWHQRRSDWRKAGELFAALLEQELSPRRRAGLLIDFGNTRLHLGEVETALAAYGEALRLSSDAGQRSTATLMIGHAHLLAGRPDAAEPAFAESGRWAEASPRLEPKVYAALAQADLASARNELEGALRGLEAARQLERTAQAEQRTTFYRPQYWQVWRRFEGLLKAAGDDWQVRRRIARSLLDFVDQICSFGQVAEPRPISQCRFKPDALPPGLAVLIYLSAESSTLVVVARREGVDGLSLPIGSSALDAKIRLLQAMIKGEVAPNVDSWRPLAQTLYVALIEPLRSRGWLQGVDRLALAPGRPLDRLPFALLLDPGGGRALIEDYELQLLPSLAVSKPLTAARGRALVMARSRFADRPDLPQAHAEGQAVADALGASVFFDQEASEARFKELAPRSRLIHVVSHGQDDPLTPLAGRIELTPGAGQDGHLTVAEIRELPLEASLVVLSSCSSARAFSRWGDDLAGGDRTGLVEAFLEAGAQKVLAALEPVEDRATAALMADFAANLETLGPAASWAQVQRRAWRGELSDPTAVSDWRQPRYWASFVLTGALEGEAVASEP